MVRLDTVFRYTCEGCGTTNYIDTQLCEAADIEDDNGEQQPINNPKTILDIIGIDALCHDETVDDLCAANVDQLFLDSVCLRFIMAPVSVKCTGCDRIERVEWEGDEDDEQPGDGFNPELN
jgi:hypothetical protein